MFHVKHRKPKIVVVGGGHAGVEAASAAARAGGDVFLVTLKADAIGVMSCNPAIGGLGKGHLVREVDAMGGIMGEAADKGGIQYRLLNRRKGPAVQGPRAQMDRELYRKAVQDAVSAQPGLTVIEDQVVDFVTEGGRISGVTLASQGHLHCDAAILTTGTFLNGVIHIGERQIAGGRMGESPSIPLAERLYKLNLPMGRLKTGTPPRLDGRTIDWDRLEQQPGDVDPVMLSFLSSKPSAKQISCAITHTNPKTHDIVRENLGRSAMYSGNISGVGPRYCPSIEDKIGRFADKDSHQIFLEPEGLQTDLVYPNGISTSLPEDVQVAYVRSIVGLEDARIVQPGYAIEYDYVDPRALDRSLQLESLPGLWLAGQINGTTGYEEAAAQGLLAGLNAVYSAIGTDPFIFSRTEAYIGVMVDDLVSRGVSEPYRMFTSRAEFRLQLRADNADQRLTPVAIERDLIDERRKQTFRTKLDQLEAGRKVLSESQLSQKDAIEAGVPLSADGAKRSGADLLAIAGVTIDQLTPLMPDLTGLPTEILTQLEREAVYTHYLDRQTRDAERLRKEEGTPIPPELDLMSVQGLSHELKQKLRQHRPKTLAQAAKVEGMTPAGLNAILLRLRVGSRTGTNA
ncbi:tRNA uridine-5-carboxymethylaminomethyl(34) synthesis enzyme MnmG [Palleronia sp. LCG004]|uniref:tRNA uridine-5-carboxymethylaminomethyl(34) synthesis enzyme MnmG n=1 Tax=Palleronia sp. LCG004 TaxID=3079304 RepID=UPI002942A61C|nr:tRNA uridine-5-carboxymethylaminomethyl(34) synthesis enzyme MnmG [Palleronia sp. LCG004]WOI55943.1 tRNA uridine-5-carboxymethylaminomethyl(34) synthesis enzyme MnmG [Palleronia sp. LCG004]